MRIYKNRVLAQTYEIKSMYRKISVTNIDLLVEFEVFPVNFIFDTKELGINFSKKKKEIIGLDFKCSDENN